MIIRDDLSTKLIHFVKGSVEDATKSLFSILKQKKLLGGKGGIKGDFKCICFTESPISKFSYVLSNTKFFEFPYAPLGIMVDKTWLYEQGGRPVIYQSDDEYDLLNKVQRYRHKSYEPTKKIDFTWEREWRIQTNELKLDPKEITIIVPHREWVEKMKDDHAGQVRATSLILGGDAWLAVNKLFWHFIVLEDLGVHIMWGKQK
jgi:hypothetical protein